MGQEAGSIAVGMSYQVPNGMECLSCLINAMQYLPNDENAFGALEICGKGEGVKYFAGGQNGQLILSRHPIKNVTETKFQAYITNRINIYATINKIRIGFGHWAFNLLADVDEALAGFMYGITQIDQAKDVIAQKPDVFVGDLNSGTVYQKEGYLHLEANGYSPVIPDNTQTWCPPSHFDFQLCINAGGLNGPYSAAIDHIMIRRCALVFGGKPHTFNDQPEVSDHLGVGATIAKFKIASELSRRYEFCPARKI